jgi:NADPH:quinone reductase-like Zn-dependent oxidoreductase
MKAAIATGIQDIDKFLHVQEDWPRPTLATVIDGKTGKPVSKIMRQDSNDSRMIVKVLACALAPGDCRLFKGKTDMMQLPKTGRPYVIGSDICGVVAEIGDDEQYFKVGDKIIARFDEPQPHGMCAEYACVKTSLSEKCPASIPSTEACTLPASAAAAKLVAERFVQPGSRILLLGASGGVGTFICQYAKLHGASFLAATTTQSKLAKSLGVDRVIDYRKENWWELESEFSDQPFDVVVDLVNGKNWQVGACSGTKVVKKNATYVQLLTGVETEIDASHGVFSLIPLISSMLGRSLYSKLHPKCPKWIPFQGLDIKPGDLKGILEEVEQNKIRVILDPRSPFSFDTESVRQAMKLQWSIHAHGKVVVQIAKDAQN